MAKFVYRMQGILDIKMKMEDQARTAYGLAQLRLNEEEEKLRNLVIRRTGYEQHGREIRAGGVTVDIREMETTRRAIESMKVMIRAQMLEVKRAEKDVESARRRLSDAMQERKMHEKLREKAFEEFKAEIAYDEMKQIDGLVSYTYSPSGE